MKQILKFFAFFAFKFNKKHIKVARANLDFVYGNSISEDRKYEIIYNSYKSLVFNMYEFIENQNIEKEDLLKKANIVNKHIIENDIKLIMGFTENQFTEKNAVIFRSESKGDIELIRKVYKYMKCELALWKPLKRCVQDLQNSLKAFLQCLTAM